MSIYETVRGSDVFIIQSTCANGVKGDPDYRSVNDQVMELLIMIDAMKRASGLPHHRRHPLLWLRPPGS